MLRRPFPVVGKCNSMQKRYGARQAVNVHSLRTGGVFAVQRPRDMAFGGQGDVAYMAENNTGVVVLHPGHGGDQVLQIQRRLGHPQQQQFELPASILTRLGSSFTSPPMEVQLHTAPKMKSPSKTSPSASMQQL